MGDDVASLAPAGGSGCGVPVVPDAGLPCIEPVGTWDAVAVSAAGVEESETYSARQPQSTPMLPGG